MPLATHDIVDRLSSLPPFPRAATKLLRLLDDDLVTIDQLAEVISADPTLVLRVLHVANSPFYMSPRPIDSIKNAVLVLGMKTIKGLTTAISIHQGFSSIKPTTSSFDNMAFWKHSYATAIGVGKVVPAELAPLREKLYLVGLIHDIGKLIQAFYWPDSWTAALKIMRSKQVSFAEAEMQVFATSHHDIAATVCRNWQFPDYMVDLLVSLAVLEGKTSTAFEPSIKALHLSHEIAQHLGLGYPADEPIAVSDGTRDKAEEIGGVLVSEIEYQLQMLAQ